MDVATKRPASALGNRQLTLLREGCWIGWHRIVGYSVLFLLGGVVAVALLLVSSRGAADAWGRPLGTDFVSFWSAAFLVANGNPPEGVYDTAMLAPVQWAVAGVPAASWFYPFLYSPIGLMLFLPMGHMPYLVALIVWLSGTFGIYLAAVRRILPGGLTLLAATAFPAVLVNVGHGQNGFLSTALFGFALVLLPHRPLVAGLCTALLIFKPQLGFLIPLAFAAGGHWRAFAAAALGACALAAMATALFGIELWQVFLTRSFGVENLQDVHAGWYKMQAVFTTVRGWGGGIGLAWVVQILVSLPVAVVVAWLWRRDLPHLLKAASLVAGTLLAGPYLVDYDYVLLALPIACLARLGLSEGFFSWERSILGLCWIMPLLARPVAQFAWFPFGPVTVLLLFALIVRRARLTGNRPPFPRTASRERL